MMMLMMVQQATTWEAASLYGALPLRVVRQ